MIGGRCVLVLWALCCSACVSGTRIYVKSTAQSNDGKTLYALVRGADAKTVSNERYQDVSAKVFSDPPDPSVLVSRPIFPGNPVTFTVQEGDAKELVIYFLFTNPGLNWRLPLHAPLPAEVYIDIGQNQIERVQMRKR